MGVTKVRCMPWCDETIPGATDADASFPLLVLHVRPLLFFRLFVFDREAGVFFGCAPTTYEYCTLTTVLAILMVVVVVALVRIPHTHTPCAKTVVAFAGSTERGRRGDLSQEG